LCYKLQNHRMQLLYIAVLGREACTQFHVGRLAPCTITLYIFKRLFWDYTRRLLRVPRKLVSCVSDGIILVSTDWDKRLYRARQQLTIASNFPNHNLNSLPKAEITPNLADAI
jgi:hypothetical protein